MSEKRFAPCLIGTCLLLSFVAAILTGCREEKSRDTVTITEPAWDSLTYPLQMPTYYATISSEKQVAQLSLRIDVYKNGKAVRHAYSQTSYFQELRPLELSSAIYFKEHENGRSGLFVMAFGKESTYSGRSSFRLNLPNMAETTRILYRFNPDAEIDPNGTTPLFAVAYNMDYFGIESENGSPKEAVEHLIRDFAKQEKALLLVFSLEASQEIREFKQADAQ